MMRTQQSRTLPGLIWLVAVVSVFFSTKTFAVEPEEVREWLTEQIKASETWPDLENIAWTFEYRVYSFIPKNEIEAMRKETRNKPDHPMRLRVESYDYVANNGPQIKNNVLRFLGPDHWRLCTNILDVEGYLDWTITPKDAWMMTADSLTLIDYRLGWPEGRRIDTMVNTARNACSELIFASLVAFVPQGYDIVSIESSSDRWNAVIRYHSDYTLRLTGHIDADRNDLVVDMTEEIDRDGATVWKSVFKDWVYDETLQRYRCTLSKRLHPDGSPMFSYRHVDAVVEQEDFFRSVFTMPDFNSTDPIRGSVSATSVYDFTSRTGRQYSRSESGIQEERLLIRSAPRSKSSYLRYIGWILGTGAIVLFIYSRRPLASGPA